MCDAVLLTHLHSDHICDLGDIVTTQWVMSPEPRPLEVIGPPRTAEVVDGVLASLAPDIGYRLAHHADLTWEPQVSVRELVPRHHLGRRLGPGDRGRHRPPAGRADPGLPVRARGPLGGGGR